jgi:hypothetical protein
MTGKGQPYSKYKSMQVEQSYGNSVHRIAKGKKLESVHTAEDVDGSPCVGGDSLMIGVVIQRREIC